MPSFKLRIAAAIAVFVTVSLGGAPAAFADDPTPPTVPGAPTVSQITEFSVTLTWAPSVDNIGVANYLIARTLPFGGAWNESTPGNVTTITIRNLTPNNLYTFTITAVDPGGNVSAPTAPASVRTLRYTAGSMCSVSYQQISGGSGSFFSQVAMTNLTTGPWQEWTLAFTLTPEQRLDPAWGFQQNGNRYSITFVWLFTSGAGPLMPGATRSVSFSGSYTGAANPPPTQFTINDHPCVVAGETVPPGVPANLAVSNLTPGSATLTWTPSTPGSAPLSGYVIYRIDPTGDVAVAVTPTPTTTTYGLTALTPGTTYRFRVRARDTLGVLSGPSPTASFLTPAPQGDCRVTYTVSDWGNGSGFTASVTITNTGTAAVAGWALKFTFPTAEQRVVQGWNAAWAQAPGSAEVTATNLDWNATIQPGASLGIGFNGSFSGSNPKPDAFRLSGQPCNIG